MTTLTKFKLKLKWKQSIMIFLETQNTLEAFAVIVNWN